MSDAGEINTELPEGTEDTPRPGRSYVSDGVQLTPLTTVPWNTRSLRILLSIALKKEDLISEGAFAVVYGRNAGAYTARRLGTMRPGVSVLITVVRCQDRWIAVGSAGTEPHEVFSDGHCARWIGPVPVEALA